MGVLVWAKQKFKFKRLVFAKASGYAPNGSKQFSVDDFCVS
jgi:hypothetical protein